MIRKVLIANRGEIALRIMRSCKLLGIQTVAIYSKCDANLLHVRLCDQAVCIGGNHSHESYLHIPSILSAAELTGADAIHPGYGFLAENATFAEQVIRCGLTFIGPSPELISKMGDKVIAIQTMRSLGIPTVPGSDGNLPDDPAKQKAIANAIGYPVMIKASGGGGGKGMAVVHSDDELVERVKDIRIMAKTCFLNDTVYLEKFLQKPRHIEVQVLGDHLGNIYCLGDRDCSIQRRQQKIIEEAPAFDLTKDQRTTLHTLCVKACQKLGYESAGTLEFLFEDNQFYFIEMNTRIQVEHPVTECITGIDIVASQLMIHSGQPLPFTPDNILTRGTAIECRINAEDPKTFMPSPGQVRCYHPPGGLGVRVDSHLYQDYRVPQYYDSLIAKLITYGTTRDEAIARMLSALDELVILGISHNKTLHQTILNHPSFQKKAITIHFLSQHILSPDTTPVF